MKPFEAAVQHLKSISGPFELDLGILRDGFIDLQARLERLEAKAVATSAPALVAEKPTT